MKWIVSKETKLVQGDALIIRADGNYSLVNNLVRPGDKYIPISELRALPTEGETFSSETIENCF